MKLTSHNARVDSSGLHNDRNYDVDLSPHIVQERINDNKYWTYKGTKDDNLQSIELEFYKEHFSSYLKERNEYNIKDGHRNRNRTMVQFYKGAQTRPEDKIIQIGDKDSHVSPEKLWECALEYQKQFEKIFGSNCKILDMSLHVDEETPHVHIRRVWIYKDEKGNERVGQTKALQEMGILRQDTTKDEGRYNNAKITFTNQDRELFRNICREKGIDVEPDKVANRKHLSVPEYKEMKDRLHELERRYNAVQETLETASKEQDELVQACEKIEDLLTNPMFYNLHDQEVAAAKKKNINQRIIAVTNMFQEEAQRISASEGSFRKVMEEAYMQSQESKMEKELSKANKEIESLNKFLEKEGLSQKYKEYKKEKQDRKSRSPHRTVLQ